MSVLVTIAVDADAFELGAVFDTGHDVRIDLLQFVPVCDGPVPYFWASGDGVDGFAAAVRDDPRVQRLTRFHRVAEYTLYRIVWTDGIDGFLDSFANHDIFVERGVGTDGTWLFTLRSTSRTVVTEFQTDCSEKGISVEIRRVVDDFDDSGTDRFDLTAKQHEALVLALEAGYFDVPREASLTELAAEIEISRQAFSRRLNRGLRGVLANTLGDDVADGFQSPGR